MKLNFGTSRRSTQRRVAKVSAAVRTEVVEQRLVLSPTVLTPTGTQDTATPEITWTPEANAVNYDVWISSLESFTTLHVQKGVTGTSFTPAADLPLGSIRVWVRSNFTGGTSSAWSAPKDSIVQPAPSITGPIGQGARHVTTDTTPVITWQSADLARRFQIWVTDVANDTSSQYIVENLTPLLDADGNQVLDAEGKVIPEEVRSFEIPASDELPMGRYRVWIRTLDQGSRLSEWSDAYQFDVGPDPQNLTPNSPTFQTSPLLEWDEVNNATSYEVYVASQPYGQAVTSGSYTRLYREIVTTNSFQIPKALPAGGYVFWVRAISELDDVTTVYGAWSQPTQFSTLIGPTITGPAKVNGFVTAASPTVEWTAIDGAARYEIYVHKFNSKSPFLQATSSTNSYTFENRLVAGKYYVWVRAIDTRGSTFSPWSDAYEMVTTGGSVQILTPTAGQQLTFPEYSWTPVADAVSYEIWVSHIGVDFTFINVSGLTDTSYTAGPVDPGNYRVWVRAMFADGTFSAWSVPVDFVGTVSVEPQQNSETLLASVQASVQVDVSDRSEGSQIAQRTSRESETTTAKMLQAVKAERSHTPEDLPEQEAAIHVDLISGLHLKPAAEGEAASEGGLELPYDALSRIAQQCMTTEWWESNGVSG